MLRVVTQISTKRVAQNIYTRSFFISTDLWKNSLVSTNLWIYRRKSKDEKQSKLEFFDKQVSSCDYSPKSIVFPNLNFDHMTRSVLTSFVTYKEDEKRDWNFSRRFFSSSEPDKSPEKPSEELQGWKWWWDKFIICLVFAIAGSSTVYFIRPLLTNVIGLKGENNNNPIQNNALTLLTLQCAHLGSLKDGPWSFRIAYIAIMTPCYSVILLGRISLFSLLC